MGDITEQKFRVQNLPMESLGLTIRSAQLNIFVLSPCTISYYSNYRAFVSFFSGRYEKYFGCPLGYKDKYVLNLFTAISISRRIFLVSICLYIRPICLYICLTTRAFTF